MTVIVTLMWQVAAGAEEIAGSLSVVLHCTIRYCSTITTACLLPASIWLQSANQLQLSGWLLADRLPLCQQATAPLSPQRLTHQRNVASSNHTCTSTSTSTSYPPHTPLPPLLSLSLLSNTIFCRFPPPHPHRSRWSSRTYIVL